MARKVLTIPSDKVEVEWDGVTFGAETTTEPPSETTVGIPESLGSLADILRSESKLLTLHENENLIKPRVLEAYGHDIDLLGNRMQELDECVRQAIRCSIVFAGDRQLTEEQREAEAKKIWEELQPQLPPVEYQHVLKLPYTLAAQDPAAILRELKQQFQQIMAQALRRLALHMKRLVDTQRVGLVSWAGEDACCYHYFCQEHRETVLREQTETEDRPTSPGFGERRTVKKREVKKELYSTRHVHHLVDAKLHNLDEYTHPMPQRVHQFLDSVPPRVRHLFQIVDGQMTMEEVVARQVKETTEVETETIAVYRYDPAVTLGDYVLVGWDSKEVAAEQEQQRKERQERIEKRAEAAAPWVVAALGLLLLFGATCGICYWVSSSREAKARAAQEAYTAYQVNCATSPVLEANKKEALKLGDTVQIAYGGIRTDDWHGIMLVVGRTMQYRSFTLTSVPGSDYDQYGDVDLDPWFGIGVTLHVLRASGTSIRYTVTENLDVAN